MNIYIGGQGESSILKDILPGVWGLIGAVIGAGGSYFAQRAILKLQRSGEEREKAYESLASRILEVRAAARTSSVLGEQLMMKYALLLMRQQSGLDTVQGAREDLLNTDIGNLTGSLDRLEAELLKHVTLHETLKGDVETARRLSKEAGTAIGAAIKPYLERFMSQTPFPAAQAKNEIDSFDPLVKGIKQVAESVVQEMESMLVRAQELILLRESG